jgi:hypothetical protein
MGTIILENIDISYFVLFMFHVFVVICPIQVWQAAPIMVNKSILITIRIDSICRMMALPAGTKRIQIIDGS